MILDLLLALLGLGSSDTDKKNDTYDKELDQFLDYMDVIKFI